MIPQRRQKVLEVLDATLAEPPGSRPAFLARACGEDEELRRDVEALLELESEAEEFLPAPVLPREATIPREEPTLEQGIRIGPYRILELLGRGGMGAVYLAERTDDFEKQVALKLLQRDLVSEASVNRFVNERQILARLEHPLIARLLDGGTTQDGRPFLVMEYVEGVPIDEYCDELELSTRKRLGLFLKVCSALAFAHQNLVVHRDLKPGNILITDDGVPKLLDFGIAKLLDSETVPRGDLTHMGEQPMTPRYASPEQVKRQPITTASDIYALGTLLYRLLTGRLPCQLESCPFAEVSWRIVDTEAIRPSQIVMRTEVVETVKGQRTWSPESVSRTRDGEPDQLRRALVGDVDAILLKALRKEPQKRYASVEQLAEDLRRHLSGLPVSARKGTFIYRGGKYLRRHKWWLTAAMISLLSLTGFFIRERHRLESERQQAEQVTSVLRRLIELADPDNRKGDTLIETLEGVRDQLAELEAEPELRADLLAALGIVHYRLGHSETAIEVARESLGLWRKNNPGDLSGLAARINNVAAVYLLKADYEPAELFLREALELRVLLGDESSNMVTNLSNLATALFEQGAFDEAESMYRRGLEMRRRSLAPDHPDIATSLRNLGVVLHNLGDYEAAEPLLREALEIRQQALGKEHTGVASVQDLLASVRFGLGDSLEAEALYQQAIEIGSKRLSADHYSVAWTERNFAALLLAEGQLETARILLTRALENLRQANPDGHWRIPATESLLGALLVAEGRSEEAEACLLQSYEALLKLRGEESIHTRDARRFIIQLYEKSGRPEMAAPYRTPTLVGE